MTTKRLQLALGLVIAGCLLGAVSAGLRLYAREGAPRNVVRSVPEMPTREVVEAPTGEVIEATPPAPIFECFNNAKDCGDAAERFCSARVPPKAVQFQTYDPTAEIPCRWTCAGEGTDPGEGGTCRESKGTARPKPKPKPGDETFVLPKVAS